MNMKAVQSNWGHVSKWLDVIIKEEDYQEHLKLLSQVMDELGDNSAHPLDGFVDLLAMRIEDYERKAFPVQEASPVDVLKLLMEQQGMNQKELENRGFDNQGNISKILNGKREMNLSHIKIACKIFNVNSTSFI